MMALHVACGPLASSCMDGPSKLYEAPCPAKKAVSAGISLRSRRFCEWRGFHLDLLKSPESRQALLYILHLTSTG